MYVVIFGRDCESTFVCHDRSEAEYAVREHVEQYLCDFFRHKGSLEVTKEVELRFDVDLISVPPLSEPYREKIDYQGIVDNWFKNQAEYKAEVKAKEAHEAKVRKALAWYDHCVATGRLVPEED